MAKLTRILNSPIGQPQSFLATLDWNAGATADAVDSTASTRTVYTATTSGTPHAAGSYSEVVAALSEDSYGLYLQLSATTNTSAVDSSTLMDIAIGAAGSEVNIVQNLGVGYKNLSNVIFFIPVFIPKGQRVSFRARGAQVSKSINARFTFLRSKDKNRSMPTRLNTIGANTATSSGIALTAPGASNVKSAWTEITSSTTEAFQGFLLTVQGAQSINLPNNNVLLDVAIGSAGNEQIISADNHVVIGAAESVDLPRPLTMVRHIPAGTRISCRYARSGALSVVDVIFHGIPY